MDRRIEWGQNGDRNENSGDRDGEWGGMEIGDETGTGDRNKWE